MNYGSMIKEARERAGLSQQQTAALIGTTQSSIAALEKGTSPPTMRTLAKLAAVFDVELIVDIKPYSPHSEYLFSAVNCVVKVNKIIQA